MTNEEPLPKKVRLSEADFKVLPRDELILRWKQYEAYVQALEGKYTDLNSNDVTGLRESEEKLKQQQQESARRENILVMRLATKEQEMQECTNQIQYLKQVQQPSVAQLRSTMVDPAINLFFLKMKGELEQTKDKLEQAQNELSAWKPCRAEPCCAPAVPCQSRAVPELNRARASRAGLNPSVPSRAVPCRAEPSHGGPRSHACPGPGTEPPLRAALRLGVQSFNVLTCSKMKVWKFAAIASMLLSSMLSILVCRDMFNGSRTYSPLPSSLSSRASSSSLPAAPRRPPRALPRHSSLLAQYSSLFESYTEGEIRQLISALVERYSQAMNSGGHELPLFPKAGNRMKRARARHKPCALKELEVSVSELGLGYESDETVLFRYCSGTCDAAVRNYDLSLKSVRSKRRIRKEKVRARPCCRPLSYDDDVSFLDAYNRYYTVNELSAKECGCV